MRGYGGRATGDAGSRVDRDRGGTSITPRQKPSQVRFGANTRQKSCVSRRCHRLSAKRHRPSRKRCARSHATRVLVWRVDWLTVAHQVDVPAEVNDEFDERQAVCALARVAELKLGPFSFSLARSRSIDRFQLENHDCRVLYDRHASEGWNVEVIPRAIFLATHTLDESLALSTEIARELGRLKASRLRRFDLAADYVGFPLERRDAENLATTRSKVTGFLTHAKDVGRSDHGENLLEHQAADRTVTGLTVAPGNPILVRIYDKTTEVSLPGREEKRTIEEELWRRAGWTSGEQVTRVEAQVRGEALDDFDLRSPFDLEGKMDGVWQYCMAWVRLVVPTTTRRSRCELDPRWQAVAATVFSQPSAPATRIRTRGGATALHALGTSISRLGATGKLPRAVQGDETEFIDAMSPAELENWLKYTLDEIGKRQAVDGFEQLVLLRGAHDAALWLAVKINARRARFWSADDLCEAFIDFAEQGDIVG
jgi:hypothetical protein